jgi:hypothetical protein
MPRQEDVLSHLAYIDLDLKPEIVANLDTSYCDTGFVA